MMSVLSLRKKSLTRICAVLLCAVSPIAADAKPGPKMSDAEIVADIRATMERLVAEDRFSGTVLLAKDGEPLFEEAYGYAARAYDAKNKVDTKFYTASMAKLFTATSIMQLAQAGKLSFDDKLIDLLPDYPNKEVASKITIRQMLMHRSGLGDSFSQEAYRANPALRRTIQDNVNIFVNNPLRFEPGSQYSYSNAGFILLGLVVEKVSGRSFEDYVRENIFKPAGMVNSGYYTDEDGVANLALNYTSFGVPTGAPRKISTHMGSGGGPAGGSGVYTTVEDLLRFAEAVENSKLLNRKHTKLLMEYAPPKEPVGQFHLYGWMHKYVEDIHVVGHGGSTPGASTDLNIYPDLGYTVAVLSNYDGAGHFVADRLEFRLTGQDAPQAANVPAESLKQYEGRYAQARPGMTTGAGPAPGGAGAATGAAGPTLGGTGLTLGGAGPTLGGTGPTLGGTGPAAGGTGPTMSGTGPTLGGAGPTLGGAASSPSGKGPTVVDANGKPVPMNAAQAGPSMSLGGSGPAIEVTAKGQALFVTMPMQGTRKFVPLSAAEFFDADTLGARLTFTKGADGQVAGMTLTGVEWRGPVNAAKLR